jgi:hypothetical protein
MIIGPTAGSLDLAQTVVSTSPGYVLTGAEPVMVKF